MTLFNIEGNKLTSLKGDVSYFYEKELQDYEAQEKVMKENIIHELDHFLINLNVPTKIYYSNGNCFINQFNKESSIPDLMPCSSPVESLSIQSMTPQFYENFLTYRSEYKAVLSIKEFCDSISPLDFIQFPDYVLHLSPIEKLVAKDKINLKRKLHYSLLFKGIKDIEAEEAYQQAENLLTELTSDRAKLLKVEMFFIVKASSKEELDQRCAHFMELFKEHNGELIREERGLRYFYETLQAGILPSFKRGHELPSTFISHFIPHHKDKLFKEGVAFESRERNSIYIDLFDSTNTNFNALISGSSGQGKSMLANKLLKNELERGTKALVLDLGNSFQKNAKFHDGNVVSYQFNPLSFNDPSYLKAFVLSCVDDLLGKKEQGRLFSEIKKIVEESTNLTWGYFLEQLEKSFPGISFYFSEINPYFTDKKENFSHLTYCDLSLYPESMKAPIIIYLLECFKNIEGRKMFIFDECWHLLTKNAEYISECFRTFRKHGASAIAISQNIDDFASSFLGKVIIQNCFHKFLFKQPIVESEFVQEELKELVEQVCSKKGVYSEFIYANDNAKKPVLYYPSYLEYELFTSDRYDTKRFENYLEEKGKYLSFKNALINFTEIKYNIEVSHV